MLHVTNGDHAADAIRAAGAPGPVLPWRDVLHDGPVPAGLPLAELSRIRAEFIASRGWASPEDAERSFRERDDALAAARDEDEVVLWFEHDLYDQLQLVQVLDEAARLPVRLTLINPAQYLGPSAPEQLRALFHLRAPVTPAQTALARAAWEAFRAPDPRGIQSLLETDTSALQHLGSALRRHLQQFPWTTDGLSRTERQALRSLADGPGSFAEAFAANQARESAIFLGDSSFLGVLADLGADPDPLVTWDDGAPVRALAPGVTIASVADHRLTLTDNGRAVLEGRAAWAPRTDRWLGGVHLRAGESGWRWNDDTGQIEAGTGRTGESASAASA
ncbi:DUF1835 domain-containing protein [Longimicrobium terrae]|uniref:DUF1835 domain-containing protein n=1 Tax=Longimicrobium terrae TaxID=1639882 RepID=A0A841GXX6_9BACT|nr:DUF1835 domain-containing protein [Longimicrobium terrae]MBB4636201.1 hypothetical protein [Longimicrobium terrae]MBB6070596.1 hypothetical protein [Longimicrobium terrae]NNC29580.1 DUF1835 domain-containing protein [Longimicrobium terrae]